MGSLDYIPNTRRAWHDGYNTGRMQTEAILTDLITELRTVETVHYRVEDALDRAEARLKGLNDV